MDWKFEKIRALYEMSLTKQLYVSQNFTDILSITLFVVIALFSLIHGLESYVSGNAFGFYLNIAVVIFDVVNVIFVAFRMKRRKKNRAEILKREQRILDLIDSRLREE